MTVAPLDLTRDPLTGAHNTRSFTLITESKLGVSNIAARTGVTRQVLVACFGTRLEKVVFVLRRAGDARHARDMLPLNSHLFERKPKTRAIREWLALVA